MELEIPKYLKNLIVYQTHKLYHQSVTNNCKTIVIAVKIKTTDLENLIHFDSSIISKFFDEPVAFSDPHSILC